MNDVAGVRLFDQLSCASCHTINGQGGSAGPDLTHIGKKRNSTWIFKYLKNPKSVYPNTIMPVVPLTNEEMKILSDYLANLK